MHISLVPRLPNKHSNCEVAIETKHFVFIWSRRGKYALSYWRDNDLSSLTVDAEGQMARFVAKTLQVCSGLVVVTYWT